MGKKVFVSYKYADTNVLALPGIFSTKVRDYVNVIQDAIDSNDHLYMGEDDGEDLGTLADSTIGSKLGDKIYGSTVTIILISKGMKENIPDKDQWIPWEVSYSLREQSRNGIRSKTNALLAVVLPDNYGNYDYFMRYNPACDSTTYMTGTLFDILSANMFNRKKSDTRICNGTTIHEGYFSYIYCVKWENFKRNINHYINISLEIWSKRDEYEIRKSV